MDFINIFLFLVILPMNTFSRTICFTIPVGAEYCATLLDYQKINNQLEATIEVTPEVWESIDLIMLFNLRWDVRNEGKIIGEKNVQLKIFLDKKIYEDLSRRGELPDKNSFLSSDVKHPIRSAMNWFATEVTEEVDLPEALKNMGTLREGFTTQWKDDFK